MNNSQARDTVKRAKAAGLCVAVCLALAAQAKDYNVTDFGAVADGKTDCTKPIRAALRAARKADAVRLIFPPAKKPYLISGTIYVTRSNIEIIGDGATLLLADSSGKKSNVQILYITGGRKRSVKKVTVRGLTIDANFWGQIKNRKKQGNPRGLLVRYAEEVLIDRVHVRRAWVSLAFAKGTRNCEARDCVVSQWHNDGFDAAYDATDIRFVRCRARDAMSARSGGLPGGRDGGWEIEDGVQRITLTDCVVEKTDCSAFKLRSHNSVSVNRNVRFIRCRALAPCRKGWVVIGRDHDTRTEGALLENCEGAGHNIFGDGADRIRILGGKFDRMTIVSPRRMSVVGAVIKTLRIIAKPVNDGKETFKPDITLENVKILSGKPKITGDPAFVKIITTSKAAPER